MEAAQVIGPLRFYQASHDLPFLRVFASLQCYLEKLRISGKIFGTNATCPFSSSFCLPSFCLLLCAFASSRLCVKIHFGYSSAALYLCVKIRFAFVAAVSTTHNSPFTTHACFVSGASGIGGN